MEITTTAVTVENADLVLAERDAEKLLGSPLDGKERRVLEAGYNARKVALEAVSMYVELCKEIRATFMTPPQVSKILKALGYLDARISEVKRVSFVSDQAFQEFLSRGLGWRATVEAARELKPRVLRSQNTLSVDVGGSDEEGHSPDEGETADTDSGKAARAETASSLLSRYLRAAALSDQNNIPEQIRRVFESKAFLKSFKEKGGIAHGVIGHYRVIVVPAGL